MHLVLDWCCSVLLPLLKHSPAWALQVAAGLTYGAEEDLFHSLFKTAWSCQPLPLLTMTDGCNVSAACANVYSLERMRVCSTVLSHIHVHARNLHPDVPFDSVP